MTDDTTDAATGGGDGRPNVISRRGVLKTGALASTTPFLATTAGAAAGAPTTGPVGVHVAYGADPRRTVTVGWTGGTTVRASVEYGEAGFSERADASAVPLATDTESNPVAYAATLDSLAPGTTYRYRAVMDDGTTTRRSKPFAVTTAPAAGSTGFTATVVADHGIADPDNPFQRPDDRTPERVIERARALDPDLHLCVGDLAYANGKPSTWERYFSTFQEFYANTPFLTVPGNHEAEPGTGLAQYDARLNRLMPVAEPNPPPNEQRWYRFRYGNALFVGLNTTSEDCGPVSRTDEGVPIYDTRCDVAPRTGADATQGTLSDAQERLYETQAAFLRGALAEAEADDSVTWTVVYFHGPLWTDAPDHEPRRALREKWGPILDGDVEGLSTAVDLVLSGDNHVYERSETLTNREKLDGGDGVTPTGTTYVVNGTGGTGHYGFDGDRPTWTAARSAEHFGPLELRFDADCLTVRYVDRDGTVVDRVEIYKTADGQPDTRA